ncbi:MAG: 2-dehydropantoate 2-reductase [Sulfitobacter sp.]
MRKRPSCGGALGNSQPHIVIAGAGAIGCYVGGLLDHAGHHVSFLGRPRILDEVRKAGLRLSDYGRGEVWRAPGRLDLREDAEVLATADIILVCVKSSATAQMGEMIAAHAPDAAIVISLQNGMGHADTLRAQLPDHDIRAGMVPFNVVPLGEGRFHRATSGDIVIPAGAGEVAGMISVEGLRVTQSDAIEAVQWGKFLINLNNAPNALSGLTLQEQLLDRDWRRLMADQMAEALGVLRAHGCAIRSTTPVPAGLVPHILRLPTPLFRRIAARMLTIDPKARTSMAYGLIGGRPTEIDALQGAVIAMGQAKSIPTPLCSAIHASVKRAEQSGLVPQTPDSFRR